MGAFITYLVRAEGIRHFFVLAPNLTIYNKLNRPDSIIRSGVVIGRDIPLSPTKVIIAEPTILERITGTAAASDSTAPVQKPLFTEPQEQKIA